MISACASTDDDEVPLACFFFDRRQLAVHPDRLTHATHEDRPLPGEAPEPDDAQPTTTVVLSLLGDVDRDTQAAVVRDGGCRNRANMAAFRAASGRSAFSARRRMALSASDRASVAAVRSRVRQVCLGLLVAATGNALVDLATTVGARSAGGFRGCDVDIGAGPRFAVLMTMVQVYPAAHIVLGGLAAGLSAIRRPALSYWVALGGGWVVLSVASVFYPGC